MAIYGTPTSVPLVAPFLASSPWAAQLTLRVASVGTRIIQGPLHFSFGLPMCQCRSSSLSGMRHHDMQLLTGPCVDLFVIPDTDEACDLLANEEPPPYHEALSEAEGSVHA